MIKRKLTRPIKIGNIFIGGNNKIAIQSMLKVNCNDIEQNINQAQTLQKAGCDIIRIAIPNENALNLIKPLKKSIKIPLVADIHFDYKLAIKSVILGVDKIRINPGNIGSNDKIKQVINVCSQYNVPIRIGVNSGSIDKNILKKYGKPSPEAMVESAMFHVKLLEKFNFNNIVLSLKSSNVMDSIISYQLISQKVNYPLHVGITETGPTESGIIKSSIGIGSLLLNGIGDTIRVSLSDHSLKEIEVAQQILKNLGYLNSGINIVSCPTCGRCNIDVIKISKLLNDKLKNINKNINIAVMGCAVNGPGEARNADIGIAGGNKSAVIFKKGKIIKTVPETEIINELINQINLYF